MKIHDILRTKGHDVVTVTPDRTVLDTVAILVEHNIGGVVVVDDDRPVGILTERDVLRLTARRSEALGSLRVEATMTREPITAAPDTDLAEVMDVMTRNRVRHLPVVDGGRLVGIISIGDVVNAFRRTAEEENSYLRDYIQGAF